MLAYKVDSTSPVFNSKKTRVDIAKSMLPLLVNEKRTRFANIYTGDESWFLFEYTQNTQWVLSKENIIEKVR